MNEPSSQEAARSSSGDETPRSSSREETSRPSSGDGTPRFDGGYQTAPSVVRAGDSGNWHRQAAVVAETEYRLAIRNQWALALTTIFAAFAIGLTTFSGASVSADGFDRTVASLAVLAVYLVPLVALAFGYDAVVGREESGWLQALFALPISRSLVVLGTYVGRAIVITSATVIGFGVAGGLLLREFGLGGFETYAGFVLATVGLSLAFLAIGILLSTIAREKTHALGLSLLAWAWFILVYDLLSLGVVAAFSLPEVVITGLLLSNPAGVYRVLVLGSLGAGGDAGFAAALASAGVSGTALVVALLAWIVVPIVLAGITIRHRRV